MLSVGGFFLDVRVSSPGRLAGELVIFRMVSETGWSLFSSVVSFFSSVLSEGSVSGASLFDMAAASVFCFSVL